MGLKRAYNRSHRCYHMCQDGGCRLWSSHVAASWNAEMGQRMVTSPASLSLLEFLYGHCGEGGSRHGLDRVFFFLLLSADPPHTGSGSVSAVVREGLGREAGM